MGSPRYRPATAESSRARHLRAVYEAIRRDRPISRAQLARVTGASKPTVARAVDGLLAAGLVRAAVPADGVKSYGAAFLEPADQAAVVLALDAGGRQLRGELVDLAGVRLARGERPLATPHPRSGPADVAASVTAAAVDLRSELLAVARVPATAPAHAVLGLGAAAGAATVSGRLAAALAVPVLVEEPVQLAALGEVHGGAGVGVDEFVLLTVGSEVRAGIVLGGRIYRGGHGAAGVVDRAPGGRGFSTDSPAAEAFLALAEQRVRLAGAATTLRPPLRVEKVLAAARSGDRLAGELVAAEARRIARYLARLASVLDPRLVVLGGGIGANGDLLLDPVRRALAGLVPHPPEVVNSRLGDRATLVGAAALGVREAARDLLAAAVAGESAAG